MEKRWLVLAVLFIARTAMGFQYQSVASVSPFLLEDLGIDYARFGVLLGLYLLPGIAFALPGGYLGRRFGDKRVAMVGLGLMTAGGLVMGASPSYAVAAAGRLLSGTGAILFNVLAIKMVADWFAGQEIVTAMAILMTSWPLGIGLALVLLPPVAAALSWQSAMLLTVAGSLAGLVLVAALYRAPASASDEGAAGPKVRFSRPEIWLVILAGVVWALFNVSFAVLPGFGPDFLHASGYTLVEASSLVSVVSWLLIVSLPLGGALAERLGRPNLVLLVCLLAIGLGLCLLPYWPHPLILLVALGLLFGPPPGIIAALPVEVLHPENRAPGMGLFQTCYYVGMPLLTAAAGLARDVTGDPAAPLLLGGCLALLSLVILGLFRDLQRRWAAV